MRKVPMTNLVVPHNENFARALYGFREFGAEIAPYFNLDDIYDLIEKKTI